jgi:hypothetical protein
MTLNPAARATARRNVSERIDRFLNGLEGVRRLHNRRKLFWLREALVDLQEGQYSTGEDAMTWPKGCCLFPSTRQTTPAPTLA